MGGKTKDYSKKYRGKTFGDDVEYEVKEDEKKKRGEEGNGDVYKRQDCSSSG